MSDESPADPPPNLVDLLDRLIEPAPPPPVPLTPQTAGWAVLAVLILAALAALAWRWTARRRADAYRRAALAELEGAGDDPAAVAAVLRRAALAAWPRGRVAALTGADWLAFLDRTGGGGDFSRPPGDALARAPYAGEGPVPGLRATAERWLRRHRVDADPGAAP